MIKISTLIYLVDNTNFEENVENAGRILENEYADVLNIFSSYKSNPSEELINKTLKMCRYI
jgi:hypothetical protein